MPRWCGCWDESAANHDAVAHYQRARRMFEKELGEPPSEELEQARKELQRATIRPKVEVAATDRPEPEPPSAAAAQNVGRGAKEHAAIEAVINAAVSERPRLAWYSSPAKQVSAKVICSGRSRRA